MRTHAVLALSLVALTGGCVKNQAPEPVIVTKTVNVPIAASCVPDNLGPKPVYPDTDEALKKAEPAQGLKLMAEGRQARDARLAQVEPVIDACRNAGGQKNVGSN